jgi:HlyD family secretion protein
MDIVRKPPRKTKKYVLAGVGMAAVLLLTFFIKNLEPAPPSVERGTLWVDTVRRGPMVRAVRGPGTLVPEQIHLISAVTAGRIEALPLRAGAHVTRETMLLELSNPDVQLQALESQRQLSAAEAQLVNLRTDLETQRLNQQNVVSQIRTQYREAMRQAETNEALGRKGLASTMEVTRAKESADDLKARLAAES